MSMTDPIADALTRIRNSQRAGHETTELRVNKTVEAILKILKEEGFVGGYTPFLDGATPKAKVELKYYMNKPVITGIERVSSPGRRIYKQSKDIQPTLNNIGIGIYSTPKGVITDKNAKFENVGGELLCKVW
ncbi:MAG: 30S ribosomal protein S8 [Leptospiraceae bacterium]|nr:30S ribosomal protein S8 [Leptospiraceae bacterium]MCB1202049.1 30S ribosomal protein S8 [Leptospiraceae bacterium]